MAESEIEEKTDRVVSFLEREGLDAIILNSQHNFAWITGGASNGIDMSREAGAASILIDRSGKRFLLANNIEMPRMLTEQVAGLEFEQLEFSWQSEKADAGTVRDAALRAVGNAGKLATDIPMFADVPAVDGRFANLRYALTAPEVKRIRELGQEASSAMGRAARKLQPGLSELEVAEVFRRELALGNMTAVVLLVAADERISSYRHSVPTAKRWKRTLLVVVCAKRHGLIVSLSRMISNGTPDAKLIKRTEAAAFVNASLWHATRPGISGAELYRIAAEAYGSVGFPDEINKHHQGGAAGYRTREWVAHPGSQDRVMTGQAFAWNPSITGTKVEETVITTGNGIEVITDSPDLPKIMTTIDGHDYHSPGILNIN